MGHQRLRYSDWLSILNQCPTVYAPSPLKHNLNPLVEDLITPLSIARVKKNRVVFDLGVI